MEVGAVPYGPRTLKGAASSIGDVTAILQSELTARGFKPQYKSDQMGSYFSLSPGFAVEGKIYYRAVGDDVILSPEVRGKSWIWILCCLGLCPAIIAAIVRADREKKAVRKLAVVLEVVDATHRSKHAGPMGPGLF